jgi:putative membrane protein
MMNGMMNGMGMMAWGVFGFLLGLVLIVLFVVAAATLVKWIWGQKTPWEWKNQERALDILKQRYARGEISKEEFERIKRDVE